MNSLIFVMLSQLPPYLVTTNAPLRVETPAGEIIVVPEGAQFTVNSHSTRLDNREVLLDNVAIFKSGFEP